MRQHTTFAEEPHYSSCQARGNSSVYVVGRISEFQISHTTRTKLLLYNAYILPIMLYGSECWIVNKADVAN